jgi:hypothetical protein
MQVNELAGVSQRVCERFHNLPRSVEPASVQSGRFPSTLMRR